MLMFFTFVVHVGVDDARSGSSVIPSTVDCGVPLIVPSLQRSGCRPHGHDETIERLERRISNLDSSSS